MSSIQKSLLPGEGVDEGPEHATESRRPDASLPLEVRHRTLGRALQASLRPVHLFRLFGSGMLPRHPINLKRDSI
jgi:hypothetical protein